MYCLRGAFRTGFPREGGERLLEYSRDRLLGAHVPYPVESFTLGCRHSSAESALYCRIFTEGVLGWEPAGFDGFSLTPHIPEEWGSVELNNVCLFNNRFDILARNDAVQIADSSGACRSFAPGEAITWPE